MIRGPMSRQRLTVRTILLVACAAGLLPIACVGPVDEDSYYSEMESVWQYLKAYSIYHERLQGDAFSYSTIDEMFDALGDTLKGFNYSRYAGSAGGWLTAGPIGKVDADRISGLSIRNTVFLDTLTASTVHIRIESFKHGEIEYDGNGTTLVQWDYTYTTLLKCLPGIKTFPIVIVDLYGNGGGDIDEMDSIINAFLPAEKGFILARERKYNESDRTTQTLEWHQWTTDSTAKFELAGKKVVVVIDQNSASASEIMVAALKDVVGATIVGSRSYGKGIGQIKIFRRDRPALQITYLQLQGISKRIGDYRHKGIDPDIIVNGTYEQILLKAVQVNEPSATSIRKLRKQATTPSPVAGYRIVYEE